MAPVVHHVELCVSDAGAACRALRRFGFRPLAQRRLPSALQRALRLGGVRVVVTQRRAGRQEAADQLPALLCCGERPAHRVDSVFNVCLSVRDVDELTARVAAAGGAVLRPPATARDAHGEVRYSVVRSCVGNVVHTLVSRSEYRGVFLPGFDPETSKDSHSDVGVTHVDHVTVACHAGDSPRVIAFYEACFGMRKFSISSSDDEEEGLILSEGVGLRLRAMEYWRCAEVGLSFRDQTGPERLMFVVVESLQGQTNCNVETFLKEHRGPGVEHIALSSTHILDTVERMASQGVSFRRPPKAYYRELKKIDQIRDIGEDLGALENLGILLDNENDNTATESDVISPKYLMQIFAHPLFSQKTFFIEVIQRIAGARGLGAGNILALVRSIREEEKIQAEQATKSEHQQQVRMDAHNLRRL